MPIERDIDVDLAAKLAGIGLDEFQQLNPQMNRPVILAAGTPQVLLPYDNANRFVRELPQHDGPLATWTAWVAPKTMKPAEAAEHGRHERGRAARRQPHSAAHAGAGRLDAGRAAAEASDWPTCPSTSPTTPRPLAPERAARRARFRARRRGDSVASVAQRYRVPAEQVAQWNDVGADATFRAGQTIVVMVRRPSRRPTSQGRRLSRASRRIWLPNADQPRARQRRSTSAWAIVARSTYSSSLPTGTPRASRVTWMPRAASACGEHVRGGLALGGEVGGDDHLLDCAVGGTLEQRRTPISLAPTPSSGLRRPISTK